MPGAGLARWLLLRGAMPDLIFVSVTLAFFALAIAYVAACERL
jgi:hypothetical protein